MKLRGRVRDNPCDRLGRRASCNFGTNDTNANSDEFKDGCHLKRVKDTKTGVASTADSISKFMKKCWSRRSSRENNAGLACGHEQVKRLESADAAQRRGTVECPKQKIEESARQVDCVCSVRTDW